MSRLMKPQELEPHPEKDLVPPLTEEERESLKADIEAKGILSPIVCSETTILDGHNRWEIAKELGIEEVPVTRLAARSEDEQLDILLGINVRRRQMNNEQKRQFSRNVLKEWPNKSDRALASMTGLSHPFIGSVRNELEMMGEVEETDTREGKDGVEQKVEKTKTEPEPDAEEKNVDSDAEDVREVEDAAEDSEPEPQENEGPHDVECPVCPAIPGEKCMDASGEPITKTQGPVQFHSERVDAWKEENGLTSAMDDAEADEDDAPEPSPAPTPTAEERAAERQSTTAKDNPEIVDMIEDRLAGRSEPTAKELYDAAKRINPALGDLTMRQFNARYVLQIKRGALGSGSAETPAVLENLDRWIEHVLPVPSLATGKLTEALASEPLDEAMCEELMAASRLIQKVVGVSRSVHSGDPAPEEDEAPEPAGMPV